MPDVYDIRLLRLLALARPMQATQRHVAAGRCLSLSLDFALAAQQRHGITLRLVKWRVAGDPDYVDHWATLLGDSTVIDLTRVQVDGRCLLTATPDSYPSHFTAQRIYPLALLQDIYLRETSAEAQRLSSRFLWACAVRLLGFDCGRAWRRRQPHAAWAALCETARMASYITLDALARALRQRAGALTMRLRMKPALPARMAGTAGTAGTIGDNSSLQRPHSRARKRAA